MLARPHGTYRERFFRRSHPLYERTIVFTTFDDRMSNTRHLGGDSCQRFAAEILIIAIPRNVALELISETVVFLTDGNLSGHPEGAPQTRIAVFGKLRPTAKLPRLMRGEIKTAIFEELAVMRKAPKVTGFRKNDETMDRSDAGELT
jgi:hypothetical protein